MYYSPNEALKVLREKKKNPNNVKGGGIWEKKTTIELAYSTTTVAMPISLPDAYDSISGVQSTELPMIDFLDN